MIAGTFSLVTLVVSVNQLILSQEFSAAGKARERLDAVIEFRQAVADDAAVPASPASPTRVLELIVESIHHDATGLADAVATHDDDELRETVVRYTNSVQERTDRIEDRIENSKFDTFSAVSAAITYDESWHLYVGTHLRGEYADSLSPAAMAQLDDLIESLELFHVAREQFKTTYLQQELTRFSQLTVYCGVPSILSAILVGFLRRRRDRTERQRRRPPLRRERADSHRALAARLARLLHPPDRDHHAPDRVGRPDGPQKDPDEGPFDVSHGDQR